MSWHEGAGVQTVCRDVARPADKAAGGGGGGGGAAAAAAAAAAKT